MARNTATATAVAAKTAGLILERAQPLSAALLTIDRSQFPGFHPQSNTYEHVLDLPTEVEAWRHEPRKSLIKSKGWPAYLRSAIERVCEEAHVPKMVGVVALVNHGLRELDTNSALIAHQALRKSIRQAHEIPMRDQTRLDDILNDVKFHPVSEYGGLGYYSFKCSEEFRDQVTGAAARLGVHASTLSIVSVCAAMHNQPGANEEAQHAMNSTVYEFVQTIEFVTNVVSRSFEDAKLRARARPSRRYDED